MDLIDLPTGDDDDSPPQVRLTPADLAAAGFTFAEIAEALGIHPRQAAVDAGPITRAQLDRLEQIAMGRAAGIGDSLPHVQALQFVLANHRPSLYGRGQAGVSTALRIVVERKWPARASQVSDGELVPTLATPPPGT